jgi:hypothetical protein
MHILLNIMNVYLGIIRRRRLNYTSRMSTTFKHKGPTNRSHALQS